MIRLASIRIQHFRSIEDSGKVDIDRNITALIGQNESGKTNSLKALYSFNQDYSYSEEDICNISNQRRQFLQANDPEEIPIVTLWFEGELALSLADAENNIRVDELRVTKFYDGHYEMESIEPEDAIEEYIVNVEQEIVNDLLSKVLDTLETMEDNGNFQNEFGDQIDKGGYEGTKNELTQGSHSLTEFTDMLSDLQEELNRFRQESNHNNAQNAANTTRNEVNAIIEEANDSLSDLQSDQVDSRDEHALLTQLPTFILHENVNQLEDSLTLDELIKADGEYRTFKNLLSLTGLEPRQLKDTEPGERLPMTESASTEITGLVNESWTQENIEIDINVDGDVLSVYLSDPSEAMNQPGNRSKGFQWFLGFYINFTARTQGEFKNSILLLDDPGVYLHPSGQKDLLSTLRQLTDGNQIIYNTHSPFLIDKDRLDKIRIVETPNENSGTKITSEFHHNDHDVLAPVRAAFGATLADSLFGNRQNVLVEGYSDKILIDAFSNYFRRRNRAELSLDPTQISVVNVGGTNKMPYFARLIATEGYDYLSLLDDDTAGHDLKQEIADDRELDEDRVILLGDIIEEFSGFAAEIEDLFDNEFYYEATLSAYRDIFDEDQVELMKMEEIPTQSIAKSIDDHLEEQGLGDLDKIRVAKEIRSVTKQDDCDDERLGDETIENISAVFSALNDSFE